LIQNGLEFIQSALSRIPVQIGENQNALLANAWKFDFQGMAMLIGLPDLPWVRGHQ
jgi:hypothetical protein